MHGLTMNRKPDILIGTVWPAVNIIWIRGSYRAEDYLSTFNICSFINQYTWDNKRYERLRIIQFHHSPEL